MIRERLTDVQTVGARQRTIICHNSSSDLLVFTRLKFLWVSLVYHSILCPQTDGNVMRSWNTSNEAWLSRTDLSVISHSTNCVTRLSCDTPNILWVTGSGVLKTQGPLNKLSRLGPWASLPVSPNLKAASGLTRLDRKQSWGKHNLHYSEDLL